MSALGPHDSAEDAASPIPALDALPVLVIDAQATGASPKHGELLEIGWAVTTPLRRDVAVRAHWLTLSPGTRVTRVVRELTGYTEDHASQTMRPDDAWNELLETAKTLPRTPSGGVPTVIHFARFETAFLRDWHIRFSKPGEQQPFPFDVVCLHALARRLYPTLPRSSLRALAGFLGHTTSLIRRASGHVEASAHVWRELARALQEGGTREWSAVRGLERAPARRPKKPAFPMDKGVRRALPTGPGVYRFVRSNGDVLYVGKAANIRKRVASHFSGATRTGERAMEMLTQALGVETTETATPLEAALLECDEVKRIDPPYNVQLREATRDAWFVDRGLKHAALGPDEGHPLGPLPSKLAVSGFGAVRDIALGSDRSPIARARAIGAPLAFAPEEAIFDEGFRLFLSRYVADAHPMSARLLVRIANRLRELHQEGLLDEGGQDEGAMSERSWDAARVARHLERAVLSGGAVLRRARWLVILSNALVRYEESGRARDVVVRDADILITRDATPSPHDIPGPREPWRDRQARFDGGRYDRLRILTTELRRVLVEGGEATVWVAGGKRIEARALRALLAYV